MSVDPNEEPALRSQAVDWLRRLEATPHDAALRAEVDGWLSLDARHRLAYDEAASLWHQAPEPETAPDAAPSAVPDVGPGLPHGPVLWDGSKARPRWWILAVAVAAVAAGLAALALPAVQLRIAADHRTGVAEVREIALADGSRVTLDASTAIAVSFTATRRTVALLSGQAFFEVTPSRELPFVVTTRGVTVSATSEGTGSEFDVLTSEEGVAVAVRSGAVTVSEQALGAVDELTPGLQLKLPRNRGPLLAPMRPDEVARWRDRRLAFSGTPLREAVGQIGRYLETVIVFADERIGDVPVMATVDLRRPAEALRTVVGLGDGRVTEVTPYLTVISSRR